MSEIHISGLNKYFGASQVLSDVSFDVHPGEKVALLGKNGSGKTTLFKIICGLEHYESGSVSAPGRIGVLDQIPVYPPDFTVLMVLESAFERLRGLEARMRALEDAGEAGGKEYGALLTEYEAGGGYVTDTELNKVCNGLDIDEAMRGRQFELLSGGEKTRVNLARLMLMDLDILLLDEPTNHLDMSSVEWLEDFLRRYKNTVLFISHDRYFIDNIAERIIELENGRVEFYSGGYSYYALEKEARYLRRMAEYEQETRRLRQLEETIERMRVWAGNSKSPKMFRRVKAMEKRLERMDKPDRPRTDKAIRAAFIAGENSSEECAVVKSLCKSYDGRKILDNVSFTVHKYEKAALIGDNGTGKTTLLRILTGDERADSGSARLGAGITCGFLPQLVRFDMPEMTALELIQREFSLSTEMARNRLAAFHFTGDDVFKKLAVLSGGEKSRLTLCLLMNRKINMLLLDEPTNHLDTQSREWIEEAMEDFDGTVLFVSHDRYFINRFADRIFELSASGLKDYKGSYDNYREFVEHEKLMAEAAAKKAASGGRQAGRGAGAVGGRRADKSAETDYEAIITALEERKAALAKEMEAAALDYVKLAELFEQDRILTEKIEEQYEKWSKNDNIS